MKNNIGPMNPFIGFVFTALLVMGCEEKEIQISQVPTDRPPASPVASHEHSPSPRPAAPLQWERPAGWEEKPLSSMRVGSFSARGSQGEPVDISIVLLSGDAGGDLANINRWRGQVELPPLSEHELESHSRIIAPHGRKMRYVSFAGPKDRIAAAIYSRENQSWFFKMTGENKAVKETEPAFQRFLETLHFHDEHEI